MSALARRRLAEISCLARPGAGALPVVLLHGIGSDAQSFVPLIEAIDPAHPVVAWEAPGYADSTPLAADWPDAGDYAQALRDLLDATEVESCALVGHSLGTLVAARFARLWPRRVEALSLISPALGYAAPRGGPLPPGVAKRIEDLDRLGPAAFAAARAPNLVCDPTARPDIVRAVERSMAAVRRPGYDQAVRMLGTGDLLADAAALAVPTQVVVGTRDGVTPPANAQKVFAALTLPAEQRRLDEIAGGGHAVCQEQPAEIARVLAAMIGHAARATTARVRAHG